MNGKFLIVAAGALAFAGAAYASDQPGTTADQWREEASGGLDSVIDAGRFPLGYATTDLANITRGAGPLNRINGTLSHTRDVDMYCIAITNPTAFSAIVNTGNDTNLALFDPLGNALAFNDNDPLGGTQAHLTSAFTAALQPGLYFLAISRNDSFGPVLNYPTDAANVLLYPTAPNNVEYGPSGVLGNWQNNNPPGFDLFDFNYTITMTGASYHLIPAPGAVALLGLGGLAAFRRRRN